MSRQLLRVLLLLGFLLSSLSIVQAASYIFIPINVPGTAGTSTSKINAQGQIVGGYIDKGTSHSFLLDNGVFIPITITDSTNDSALGINNRGQIVGGYVDTQGIGHGYL
jgi:uncharacterized membrane protein